MEPETRQCTSCGEAKPLISFDLVSNRQKTKKYRKRCCHSCRGKAFSPKTRARISQAAKTKRQAQPAWAIWIDARSSDRKAGLESNLTKEFIAAEIAKGCAYCGESEIRMTLDRIHNNVGHLMTNVVPACIRCNYTRKDMPYEAWLLVAKGMREAREAGLFKGWTGRVK